MKKYSAPRVVNSYNMERIGRKKVYKYLYSWIMKGDAINGIDEYALSFQGAWVSIASMDIKKFSTENEAKNFLNTYLS